ncbi:hypothetical protein A1O1_04112 [Capronia coronata CBS 617.96]|uniref:Transcription factor domain-containing protein n=1 Tax=Capronia coronata CBS 617.96 TaxID=1182541 RepID=W9YMV4_9EURO|nr:uncharacterized protein A1O1_04112 [Capronia coronata CBS 617.96]EXJ91005.1 hypothetical protein A1O1_04112 [Capronia coronata CBS 617.96]
MIQLTPEELKSPLSAHADHGRESFFSSGIQCFDQIQTELDDLIEAPFNKSPKSVESNHHFAAAEWLANFRDPDSLQLFPMPPPTEDSGPILERATAVSNEEAEEHTPYPTMVINDAEESMRPPEQELASAQSPPGSDVNFYIQQFQSSHDTPEVIWTLFNLQTCKILSIKDNVTKNPWRTLIWPLAKNCPPLYHALAAMTCTQMSRTQPQFRARGKWHFERGIQALNSTSDDSRSQIPLEAALACRLALGFAESWNHQISSTGITHISAARTLIRQAVFKARASNLSANELSRLSFLANTWMYMDVLARITVADDVGYLTDHEVMTACSLLSPVPRAQQIDPLMGCAITLFPLISRLADLVSSVRRRRKKGTSLSTISKATELRLEIERWTTAIEFQRSEGSTSNAIPDSIQTAEAYRWASLLLLRQTAPEVPWAHSIWELAQKALVYLATIPLESPTTIVQIFPLMVAGCEAFEEEDRDWVRQRWQLMSKSMITGIVVRCLHVTEEVWRRRDVFETNQKSCRPSAASRHNSPLDAAMDIPEDEMAYAVPGQPPSRRSSPGPSRTASATFPDSLVFKKRVDPLTRAGYTDYTVTGDLHWLGVMKDWGWESKYIQLSEYVLDARNFRWANTDF